MLARLSRARVPLPGAGAGAGGCPDDVMIRITPPLVPGGREDRLGPDAHRTTSTDDSMTSPATSTDDSTASTSGAERKLRWASDCRVRTAAAHRGAGMARGHGACRRAHAGSAARWRSTRLLAQRRQPALGEATKDAVRKLLQVRLEVGGVRAVHDRLPEQRLQLRRRRRLRRGLPGSARRGQPGGSGRRARRTRGVQILGRRAVQISRLPARRVPPASCESPRGSADRTDRPRRSVGGGTLDPSSGWTAAMGSVPVSASPAVNNHRRRGRAGVVRQPVHSRTAGAAASHRRTGGVS